MDQIWCVFGHVDILRQVPTHFVDPVRVEDAQASDLAANALLRDAAQVAGGLQLRDALAGWLSVNDTLFRRGKGMSDHQVFHPPIKNPP